MKRMGCPRKPSTLQGFRNIGAGVTEGLREQDRPCHRPGQGAQTQNRDQGCSTSPGSGLAP